jgi:hypothetical protein
MEHLLKFLVTEIKFKYQEDNMKNRLHELDLGTGGEDSWNTPPAGGGDSWNTGGDGDTGTPRTPRAPRRDVDVTPLVKEVQNKLKELDASVVISGKMDQETINKIMLQINKLVEKQDKEAEAKRKEEERIAAIKPVDSALSSRDL